jgi:ribosomal protein S10
MMMKLSLVKNKSKKSWEYLTSKRVIRKNKKRKKMVENIMMKK